MATRETWGDYLDFNKEELAEVMSAFRERGCPVTLYEAALYREIALQRSTIVEGSDYDREEREEADAWKRSREDDDK